MSGLRSLLPRLALGMVLGLALGSAPAPAAAPPAGDNPARNYFTDVVLLDQDGRERRLYSDLLQGRVVVINAFFTSCNGVCPVLTRNLAKVQEWLGPRLGREAFMLSFSVDPETDTPERCKAFAETYGARAGWSFLTGSKQNVEAALRKLGQYV